MRTVIKTVTTVILALSIFFVISCKNNTGKQIIDRAGITVTINRPINRIISTAPSNTEIIADLGQAHKLVAIDRHSANVGGIPGSLPLLDFFYPDAETIINLEPDLVIANGHNPTGSGDDPFRLLREAGIAVTYISMSKSIDDIYDDIAFIAELLGARQNGDALIASTKARIAEITQTSARIEKQRTVYFEISAAPEMFTFGKGSFLNDMIAVIGGKNIFENDNWIVSPGAEAVIDRNPDVILTNVDYIEDPIGELKSRPGFNHINAIINNRVYQIDTDASVRPSAHIVKALEQMSRAVYPELYE